MGLQGALFGAFNILDVNPVALTGTELLLGIRLAQRIGRRSVDQPAGTRAPFLVALLLSYTLAAFVVALALPWTGTAFIPCLLVVGAVVAILVTTRGGGSRASGRQDGVRCGRTSGGRMTNARNAGAGGTPLEAAMRGLGAGAVRSRAIDLVSYRREDM